MPPADKHEDGTPDTKKFENVNAVFWIVPLYVLAIGFLLLHQVFSNYEWVWAEFTRSKNPALIWKRLCAAALVVTALTGIAVRSIECAMLLKTDPFRAFAMGRYIIALYLIISVPLYAYAKFPASVIEAPIDAVTHTTESTLTLDISNVDVWVPGVWGWLWYVADVGGEFAETFGLAAFAFGTYRLLLGKRPPYTLDNFWSDVTFGWKGARYQ